MCSLLSLRTGSAGANIRFFPDDGRLSVSWELGRREWFNEAETSSPLAGFGLTPSSSGRTTPFAWITPDRIASRASLLSPADAQLDVERTILIIDTFQPIRTTSHCWCYQEVTETTERRVCAESNPCSRSAAKGDLVLAQQTNQGCSFSVTSCSTQLPDLRLSPGIS